jgi:hypothetical protein
MCKNNIDNIKGRVLLNDPTQIHHGEGGYGGG